MNIQMAQFLILTLILLKIVSLKGQCNVCSPTTQMVCISDTTYQFCANGAPTGTINSCPTGYVCSTSTTVICQLTAAGAVPTCNDCNRCDTNSVFACTGINTYALCFGQATPSAVTGSCGTGNVCNLNSPQICQSSTTAAATCPLSGTITPTTSTTTVATPTFPTTVPTYAQYFCSVMQRNSRFQVPSEFDNTCKRYILCFRTTAGTWSGQVYTCAGSTFFDPISLYCVATRPTNC